MTSDSSRERNGGLALETMFIIGKQLAEEDGKIWEQLSGEERNIYYVKADNLPRQ